MGKMDGYNRKRIPKNRGWLDDIKEWCQKNIHLQIRIIHERNKWRQVVTYPLNTYEHSAHGS